MMNRRDFLVSAGAVTAASITPAFAEAAPSGLSILQGLTTQTSTQLSIDVDRDMQVVYTLTDVATKKVLNPTSVAPVTHGSSNTRVDKVKFDGLELGHRYNLVIKNKKNNATLDSRFLSPVDLNKRDAKFAIMSCMDNRQGGKGEIWGAAEKANLDYLFFIGDNVYGDLFIFHGPSYLWNRYLETRRSIPYYHWKNLKPVIAVWDDHDFGKNDEGSGYKYKNHAYHIFQAFFAQEPEGQTLMRGYANSSYFQAFNQNFVFFDNRYYRGETGPSGPKFLGTEQIDWMSTVVAARPKPTFILQGSPIFGRAQKEVSYQHNAPNELDYLFSKIRSWNAPVLFGAGDVHYSEVSTFDKRTLGYDSYELISSCMHSMKRSKPYDNPNPSLANYMKENFLVIQQKGADPAWNISCVNNKNKVQFEMDIKIG